MLCVALSMRLSPRQVPPASTPLQAHRCARTARSDDSAPPHCCRMPPAGVCMGIDFPLSECLQCVVGDVDCRDSITSFAMQWRLFVSQPFVHPVPACCTTCSGSCSPGYYCPAGSTSATAFNCTAGSFCTGAGTPVPCGPGRWADVGAVSCSLYDAFGIHTALTDA